MSDDALIDSPESFFLGGVIDPVHGERTGEIVHLESHHLTTHGVIVGMTGSGKTGLGIGLLEEALIDGVPCLVIDPKGDMGNLALNFPNFEGSDFRPWIDEGEARRNGEDPDEVAAQTAATWEAGLKSWHIEPARLRTLEQRSTVTIYTPGSSAGVPLNIIGSLEHPGMDFEDNAELLRDEIEGYVSSILTLADVDADPVSGREHILLSNIIEQAWTAGESLTIEKLIGEIPHPSKIRKLGVFDLDTFFPEKDRMAFAMQLNTLVASPSFQSWSTGVSLNIESLLYDGDKPRAAVLYLAHLSDGERQFVVTLLLSKLVTWMRTQQGTSSLRALVYMDEVFGFAPPSAEPPSKKPILTILKQARAFGVGMVLSTQNPVDLDYKAMSNAGTWMVGRLQTERDKARILEGLTSAAGDTDVGVFDEMISGLGKRQFVLQSTRRKAPTVFGTRWAQSFLAGPLTREQVSSLTDPGEISTPDAQPSVTPEAETAPIPDDTVALMPDIADGIDVSFVTDSTPWLEAVGADSSGSTLSPVVAATVDLLYDDQYADVSHTEEFEAIIAPVDDVVTSENLHIVDHDARDFTDAQPPGAGFAILDEKIQNKTWWRDLESSLKEYLYRNRSVTVFKNPDLKLYSRIGESESEFTDRCRTAAEDAADEAAAALRDKYEARLERVKDQLRAAERRVDELEVDVSSRKQQEVLGGVGDLLGSLFGGKRTTTALKGAASRRSQVRRIQERLETAEAKVADKADDIVELEADLADDILEITSEWEDKAENIETVEIGLEKTDISVRELRLAWVRTAD
jgi:uncharacterized protein YjbJ (UPF0337 family)